LGSAALSRPEPAAWPVHALLQRRESRGATGVEGRTAFAAGGPPPPRLPLARRGRLGDALQRATRSMGAPQRRDAPGGRGTRRTAGQGDRQTRRCPAAPDRGRARRGGSRAHPVGSQDRDRSAPRRVIHREKSARPTARHGAPAVGNENGMRSSPPGGFDEGQGHGRLRARAGGFARGRAARFGANGPAIPETRRPRFRDGNPALFCTCEPAAEQGSRRRAARSERSVPDSFRAGQGRGQRGGRGAARRSRGRAKIVRGRRSGTGRGWAGAVDRPS